MFGGGRTPCSLAGTSRATRGLVARSLRVPNVGTVVYGGVEIGRYFSCGRGAEMGVAPHPLTGLSTHGFTVNNASFPGIEGYGLAVGSAPRIPEKLATRIGHDVWIGAQVVVMPGVTIHTGAVVAANAVVTKDVEPYEIVGGVPARHIGFRFTEDIRHRLLASEWWNLDHDVIQRLPYRDALQAVAALETSLGPPNASEKALSPRSQSRPQPGPELSMIRGRGRATTQLPT